MAELIGLRIQGIRSISDKPHLIQFLHPLTIIQGPNGTGKTTIIEALNYITTGALPPGKMQSFIHNNRLANRSRVDALVQLKFKDIKGNVCTATKRMFASNSNSKEGKPTTKSDEFTLMITDKFKNEKSISSKVADFNKEMLNLLGVPKAILEHVIFCHQEESNWPLSEPKELKVRFDAIFEVTKYVKALDNIKKNIKELEIQLRLIDKEFPHLEANRQDKANLNFSYDDSKAIFKNNIKIIDKFLADKEIIDKRIMELSKDVEIASKVKYKTDILTNQIQLKQQFVSSMKEQDFEGTREELVAALNQLHQDGATVKMLAQERKNFVHKTENEIRKAEEIVQNSTSLANKCEQSCNQITNTIQMKQKDLTNYIELIAEATLTGGPIDDQLKDISQFLKKARSELGVMDGRGFLYEKWEIEAGTIKSCPLCDRLFLSANDTTKFVEKMRINRENIPLETSSLQAKILKYEEEERRLFKMQPFETMVDNLERNEIPNYRNMHKQAFEKYQRLKQKKEADESELCRLQDKLRGVQSNQVDIYENDNKVRVLEEQLRKLDFKTELEDLKKQLDNNQWNGRDPKILIKENEELLKQATELNNKIQQKYGEQSQIETKLKEITREMHNPRYAEAKNTYLKKFIERAVVTAAIQDLTKFWKVLDDSIIKFHQGKMEQINQILRELWVRVYCGNDIETIKIKSQPVSEKEKKKSYDYSVVMTVDQIDIDMRDHCSAGQKMLASILIRIALADVFAGNCPILALDEPTTNLDSDKVENIGAMLKSLLEYRNTNYLQEEKEGSQLQGVSHKNKQLLSTPQRSLQLLVITHDRRLVDHLYLACRPEYIYGLRKDNNGLSIIQAHSRVYETNQNEEYDEDEVDRTVVCI